MPDTNGPSAYVTFVNPEPRKGVFIFARIVDVLSQRRPDIPLLVVEGVAKKALLPGLGIDFSRVADLRTMPTTPNPRDFYALTKILLMPSLAEPAGMVAMEAMLNGIPVLASRRGGLPEVVGDGGFLLDIPDRCTVESRASPYCRGDRAVGRDDHTPLGRRGYYAQWSEAARQRGQFWHPDHLRLVYREFFENIFVQPGPPVAP